MAVDSSLLESLARLALFAELDRAELATLAAMAEEASFGEGEWILRRGQENVSLHVIVDGEVSVVFEEEELAVLPPGGFFGEISALLAEPAVADIVDAHSRSVPRRPRGRPGELPPRISAA